MKADLHLETLWAKNIAVTTRLVDTSTTPMLLKSLVAGKLPNAQIITHCKSVSPNLPMAASYVFVISFQLYREDESVRNFQECGRHESP